MQTHPTFLSFSSNDLQRDSRSKQTLEPQDSTFASVLFPRELSESLDRGWLEVPSIYPFWGAGHLASLWQNLCLCTRHGRIKTERWRHFISILKPYYFKRIYTLNELHIRPRRILCECNPLRFHDLSHSECENFKSKSLHRFQINQLDYLKQIT